MQGLFIFLLGRRMLIKNYATVHLQESYLTSQMKALWTLSHESFITTYALRHK